MDYENKKNEYEQNRKQAEKIKRSFSAVYYATVIPTALMLLIDVIAIVVGTVTLGMFSNLTPKSILLTAINIFLIVICIEAHESKEKLKILIVIGILILRTAVIGLPFGVMSIMSLISIVLWICAYGISPQWEHLKNQEGFPNFNTIFIKDYHSVANTNGKKLDQITDKKDNTVIVSSEMEDLSIPDQIELEQKK